MKRVYRVLVFTLVLGSMAVILLQGCNKISSLSSVFNFITVNLKNDNKLDLPGKNNLSLLNFTSSKTSSETRLDGGFLGERNIEDDLSGSGIFPSGETVTDIDGNVYNTVVIGKQVWMVENLKVTKYRNGDPIPNVKDDLEWKNTNIGAYCDYNNKPSNSEIYGRLYNWHAVSDSRGLAPKDWHIPTEADWQVLVDYLGGNDDAGGKLKEAGTTHWGNPNTGANNKSGFSALPAGYRNYEGIFSDLGYDASWWTSSDQYMRYAWYRSLTYSSAGISNHYFHRELGFSVRCIRDKLAR